MTNFCVDSHDNWLAVDAGCCKCFNVSSGNWQSGGGRVGVDHM